jgi:Transposase DDE domain
LHEIVISPTLTLWLVTTLESSSQALAELYGRRQDIETDIRDVKVTLCLEQQRARSVEMLRKELATSMIAYNLVIQIRRLAAKAVNVPPRRLSFKGTWSAVKIILLAPQNWTAEEWLQRFQLTLRVAGERKLPNRPGRSYPRAAHTRTKKWTDGKKKSNPKKPM